MSEVLRADVAVVGGGLGGVAAALAAAESGARVVLTEAERMVGGQVTSQLTTPLDEHPLVESTGVSASYRRFRDLLRAAHGGRRNPGGGWVSRLCVPPLTALRALEDLLRPHQDSGHLVVRTSARPVAVEVHGGRVHGVELEDALGRTLRVMAPVVLDATETGDLLPLAGAHWVVGSEGQDAFGEPHALPGGPVPSAEQSCTWAAAVVLEDHVQPRWPAPARYEALRASQPFTFDLAGWDRASHRYRFGTHGPDGRPPFWTYRRVHDSSQLGGRDAAVLNWAGNDYAATGLVADPHRTRRGAHELTLAFVHWLRTDAPRDGSGRGYPELRLAPEVSLSDDGMALAPYVRESRRLRTAAPVTEHHLAPVPGHERASALQHPVGTAWYHADLHARIGAPDPVYGPTAPFQIPLAALVAPRPDGLLAAAKNLGVTQVAAAAYRVHPGEWAVGEAAGTLGALAARSGRAPGHVDPVALQVALLSRGVPLVWSVDLVPEHPAFVAGQLLAAAGGLAGARARELATRPDEPPDDDDLPALIRAARVLGVEPGQRPDATTWGDVARALAAPLLRLSQEVPA